MTLPQLPLGDDGELDLEDSREFPALRSYKPKRGFLKDHWPYLLIGLYPLLYGIYRLIGSQYIPLLMKSYEFDQSVDYWSLMNFIQITPYLYLLPLVIIIPGIIGLFRRQRTCVGLFLGLFGLIGGGVAWVGILFLIALGGHTFEHHDTLKLDNQYYHLAFTTPNLDPWGHYFMVFVCGNSDNECSVDISDSITMFPTSEKFSLGYDVSSRKIYVYQNSSIVYVMETAIDDNVRLVTLPDLLPITEANTVQIDEVTQAISGGSGELMWSRSGNKLVKITHDNMWIYTLQENELNPRPSQLAIENSVYEIGINPVGSILAVNSPYQQNAIILYDNENFEEKGRIPLVYYGTVAISTNGQMLAIDTHALQGSSPSKLRIIDAVNGDHLFEFAGNSMIFDAAFSSDDKFVAASIDLPSIQVWDLETRESIFALTVPDDSSILSMIFSPVENILALGFKNTIQIWDVESGELVSETSDQFSNIGVRMAFDPTGQILASSGIDGEAIYLWNPHTGEHLVTLEGHTNEILSFAFNPQGTILASTGWDGTIRLWGVPET